MAAPERSVLHVLPHPGGGGETYIDLLDPMPAYRFDRIHLAPSPTPSPQELARGVANVLRHCRRHDLLHFHGEVASGLCLPVLATHESVVTLHGLHLLRRLSGIRRKAAVLNLRVLLRTADQVICVSETEHAHLGAAVGPAALRAATVRNGVRISRPGGEVARTHVRAELGVARTEPVGIWVGSLDERKDPLTVVRAAEHASVALLVVGDGPLRLQAERAARSFVRVLGHRDDVPRLLAAADFFVHTPSREGLAFSLLEAMACGLPAVVTEIAENVEAIGDAGVAVPWGDEAALTAALRRLAENESERATLGARARKRVAERFTADEMIARTCAIYDEVISHRRKPRARRDVGDTQSRS